MESENKRLVIDGRFITHESDQLEELRTTINERTDKRFNVANASINRRYIQLYIPLDAEYIGIDISMISTAVRTFFDYAGVVLGMDRKKLTIQYTRLYSYEDIDINNTSTINK